MIVSYGEGGGGGGGSAPARPVYYFPGRYAPPAPAPAGPARPAWATRDWQRRNRERSQQGVVNTTYDPSQPLSLWNRPGLNVQSPAVPVVAAGTQPNPTTLPDTWFRQQAGPAPSAPAGYDPWNSPYAESRGDEQIRRDLQAEKRMSRIGDVVRAREQLLPPLQYAPQYSAPAYSSGYRPRGGGGGYGSGGYGTARPAAAQYPRWFMDMVSWSIK